MQSSGLNLLQACIEAVAAKLAGNEAIIAISRGVPLFSKNTQVPFIIYVATLDGTGQAEGQKRSIVALVTSNSPHQVTLKENLLPEIQWSPL